MQCKCLLLTQSGHTVGTWRLTENRCTFDHSSVRNQGRSRWRHSRSGSCLATFSYGFATLGTIGFEGRFDYAAIGTVSNVASRLCDEAKAGQVLISPRVLLAVEDAVIAEQVGEFALKGIRQPIAAYNIIAAVAPNL